MPDNLDLQSPRESSTQGLLAEHARIAELYLYNREMGEKRLSFYLTIVSIAVTGFVALTELRKEEAFLIEGALALLVGVSLLGLFTFQRLVERRIVGTEYLRAINRIHCYFAHLDPSIRPYYYWPLCDDRPTFGRPEAAMAGLSDLMIFFNSLSLALLLGLTMYLLKPQAHYAVLVVEGLAAGAITWALQRLYERRSFAVAQRQASRKVRFPQGGGRPRVQEQDEDTDL